MLAHCRSFLGLPKPNTTHGVAVTTRIYFLPVLRPPSLRPRCQPDCFLGGLSPWLIDSLSYPRAYTYGLPSVHSCAQISSSTGISPVRMGPTLTKFILLLQRPHLHIQSHFEIGGG